MGLTRADFDLQHPEFAQELATMLSSRGQVLGLLTEVQHIVREVYSHNEI